MQGSRFYSPKASVNKEGREIWRRIRSVEEGKRARGWKEPEEEERKEERSLTGGPSMSAADQRPMRDAGARADGPTGRDLGSAQEEEAGREGGKSGPRAGEKAGRR
jgi:hypothetical protein